MIGCGCWLPAVVPSQHNQLVHDSARNIWSRVIFIMFRTQEKYHDHVMNTEPIFKIWWSNSTRTRIIYLHVTWTEHTRTLNQYFQVFFGTKMACRQGTDDPHIILNCFRWHIVKNLKPSQIMPHIMAFYAHLKRSSEGQGMYICLLSLCTVSHMVWSAANATFWECCVKQSQPSHGYLTAAVLLQ